MRYYGEPSTRAAAVFQSKVAPLLSGATGLGMSVLIQSSNDSQYDADIYKISYHNKDKEFYGFWEKECTYEYIVMPKYEDALH